MSIKKISGLSAGLILALLVGIAPLPGLSFQGKAAAATAVLMAVWWVTEALPLAATSLVPLALYPLFSILKPDEVSRLYADPNIFLFLGGFLIAIAMHKCGLDRRIALHIIHWVGASPRRLTGGFMLATAFISMWVSNTATTMMMLPIGLAVIEELKHGRPETSDHLRFSSVLMLSIAYCSSIGGVATLVGTPPNMIFAGQSRTLFPDLPEVGFVQWMMLGLPIGAGFLAIAWVYFTGFLIRGMRKDFFSADTIPKQLKALGPWSSAEKKVMIVFVLTVLAWIFRSDVKMGNFNFTGWATLFGLKSIHDGTVAIVAGLSLFMLSGNTKQKKLLDWAAAKQLPWDVILLFGGGFALAEGIQSSGLGLWLSEGFNVFQGMPYFLLLFSLCLITIFASEFMSNAAQVTIMMPILASAAKTLNLYPYSLMVPATIATSFAFMMPAGTAPNAIVFGSGYVTMKQMVKSGFILNLLAVVWIAGICYWLMPLVYGTGK